MARDVIMTLQIRGVPDSKLDQEVIDAVGQRLGAGGVDQEAPWTDWEARIVQGIVRINRIRGNKL